MKKIKYSRLFLVIAFLSAHLFAVAQKNEKAKLTYDTAAKVLYRTRLIEVTEVIDTARLYAEKTRLLSEIDRLNMQLDSTNAQIKEARKLMNKKKGGGNKLGELVFDPQVNIVADPWSTEAPVMPWDGEGLPRVRH